MVLKILFLFFLTLTFTTECFAHLKTEPDVDFVQKKLKQKKMNPRFIKDILKIYESDSFSSVVKLNMLSFLNPPQHSVLVTEEGIYKSEEFIRQNKNVFSTIEKRDHVPASVIAALLWVETKHGKLTGHYNVISVFLHLIQTRRTKVLDELIQVATENEKLKAKPQKYLKKIITLKSKKKSDWAFEQLAALEKLYNKDRKFALNLEGSFAGAFGIPQFIPTSYFTYARPFKKALVSDLYKPEDAISSVGFYLKKEGWNSKKKSKKMKALMHYNNSEDYASSILDLSNRIVSISKK